jgi:hypothetical protein
VLSLCAFKNYFASLTLFLRNFMYIFVISRFLFVHIPSPLLANTCDKEGKSWDLYVTIALGLKNLPLIHSYDSIQALNKSINKSERGHDLVIASYVLGEIPSLNDRITIVRQLWDLTRDVLVLVEPGTPHGSNIISQMRSHILWTEKRLRWLFFRTIF